MENKIVISDELTLDNSRLYGGVNYRFDLCEDNFSIGNTPSAEVSFTTDYDGFSINDTFELMNHSSDDAWTDFGLFYVKDITKDKNKYTIKAYDSMCLLDDIEVDDFIESISFPISLRNLFVALCDYAGLGYYSMYMVNRDVTKEKTFSSSHLTARQLLSYIAENAGCNAVILHYSGKEAIELIKPTSMGMAYAYQNDYTSFECKDYTTDLIDCVKAQMSEDDSGISYPADGGDNAYIISYNPLLFTDDTHTIEDVRTQLQNIYDVYSDFTYTPCEITTWHNIKPSRINTRLTIERNNTTITGYITSFSFSSSGYTYKCAGAKSREQIVDSEKSEINALSGKYNKLTRTVEETVSEVGDLKTGYTEVKQTTTEVSSVVNGKITYTESSTEPTSPSTGDVWKNGDTYKQYNGTEWVEITEEAATNIVKVGNITNTISQSLNGVVFESSLKDGTTTIDGDCIKTGTIDAARLNLTGEITFDDLDEETQEKINTANAKIYRQSTQPTDTTVGALWYNTTDDKWYTYNGSTWETTDIPSYITKTKITATTIESPTISGTDINVLGGTFSVKDTSGEVQYGYIGKGTGNDGTATTTGVVLSYTDPTGLGTGNYYIICTSKGVRLQAGASAIYLSDGSIKKVVNGTTSDIGMAVFG